MSPDYASASRLSGTQFHVPADLQQAQSEYTEARAALEAKIPRARHLCRRFEVNDPWSWILKIKPGMASSIGSALGANERELIMGSLRKLEFRVADDENLRRISAVNHSQSGLPICCGAFSTTFSDSV